MNNEGLKIDFMSEREGLRSELLKKKQNCISVEFQ